MTDQPNPIPEGFEGLIPSLAISGCARAIAFYKEAFDAVVLDRIEGLDDTIMHAMIKIGESVVMMSDEFPDKGHVGPETLGGTPVGLWRYVEDVDAAFEKAVAAGATAAMEPTRMFWGDRMAAIVDPFGHKWSLASHVEDVSPEEMEKRQQQAREEWS